MAAGEFNAYVLTFACLHFTLSDTGVFNIYITLFKKAISYKVYIQLRNVFIPGIEHSKKTK